MSNLQQAELQIKSALKSDVNLAAAWDSAESALVADGVNISNLKFEELVPALAGKNQNLSALAEMVEACVAQDQENAKSTPKRHAKTVDELVEPGKPLLITARGPRALQTAKEMAWKRGVDPVIIETDLCLDDVSMLEAEFLAAPENSFIVVDGLDMASETIRKAVAELMKTPDHLVVVAVRGEKPLAELPPEIFGHWVKY